MSEERPPDVLGSLPRTRPHRRSDKRARLTATPPAPESVTKPAKSTASAKPATRKPAAPRRKPAAAKPPGRRPAPVPEPSPSLLGTAVQAAAELAEIGLSASARAAREMLARLPRL